jgi:hypothetical protein
MSIKQKINTKSLTEAELVGVNDAMNFVEWIQLFVEQQIKSINSFQAIGIIRGARYGVFTNKKHALNTLKMDRLLRSDVMLS